MNHVKLPKDIRLERIETKIFGIEKRIVELTKDKVFLAMNKRRADIPEIEKEIAELEDEKLILLNIILGIQTRGN